VPEPTYAYGDNEVAGDRLALLAEVFEPSTATFLDAAMPPRVTLAVDLGCGPGYTTRLLAARSGAARTVGLDSSAAFVARARDELAATPGSRIEVLEHDVTVVPFPVGPADVVFARYLLAHLPDPEGLVDRWLHQVRIGGRLLVEEIVAIDTDDPVLGRYVELVTALSAAQGTDLLVGGRLRDAGPVVRDEVVTIAPSPAVIARLFAMNLGVWREGAWARSTLEPTELDRLDRDLRAMVDDPPPAGAIVWRHRQVAYERH
jgi:SAM-dependent methyltransferase